MTHNFSSSYNRERLYTPMLMPHLLPLFKSVDSYGGYEEYTDRDDQTFNGDYKLKFTKNINAELKIRFKYYDDCLIETISNDVSGSPGWIYKTEADLYIYAFLIDGRFGEINISDMQALKKWWCSTGQKREAEYFKIVANNGYYRTISRGVPWEEISDTRICRIDNENITDEVEKSFKNFLLG